MAGHSNQELSIDGQHIDDIQHLTGIPPGKIPGFDPCYERLALRYGEEKNDRAVAGRILRKK